MRDKQTTRENPYGVNWDLVHVITSLPLDVERLTEILDTGADPNTIIIDNEEDFNVLQYASLYGHTEAIRLLLEHGATPDGRGRNLAAHTALGISCESGHTDIVRLLLSHGADVNKMDSNKRTPLHKAANKGRHEIASMLIEHGADVNMRSLWGYTPLHVACHPGCPDLVHVLLDAGADPTITDWEGDTPLNRVVSLSPDNPAREEIIDLFREHHPEMVMEAWCSPGLQP